MEPALLVLLGFFLFFGTHVGLATAPIRTPLVERLGERGFVNAFSVVATVSFAIWVAITANVRSEGWPGFGLAQYSAIRPLAIGAITIAFALAAGSLANYAASPMALFSHPTGGPAGVARVTRHGFFVGIALFGLGHVLVAPTLASAVFFLGLIAHALIGAWHQDRKLRRKLGAAYAAYLERTSAIPFAAILAGRQEFAWREQPWLAYAVGVVLAYVLRQVHADIFAFGGLFIILSVAGGGAIAGFTAERAARKRSRLAA